MCRPLNQLNYKEIQVSNLTKEGHPIDISPPDKTPLKLKPPHPTNYPQIIIISPCSAKTMHCGKKFPQTLLKDNPTSIRPPKRNVNQLKNYIYSTGYKQQTSSESFNCQYLSYIVHSLRRNFRDSVMRYPHIHRELLKVVKIIEEFN